MTKSEEGVNITLKFVPAVRLKDFNEDGCAVFEDPVTLDSQLEQDFKKVDFISFAKECLEEDDEENGNGKEQPLSEEEDMSRVAEKLEVHPVEKLKQRIAVSKYELDVALDVLGHLVKQKANLNISDQKLLDSRPIHVSKERLQVECIQNASFAVSSKSKALEACSAILQNTRTRLLQLVNRDNTFYRETATAYLKCGYPLRVQAIGKRRQFVLDYGFFSERSFVSPSLHFAKLIRKPLSVVDDTIPTVVLEFPPELDSPVFLKWTVLVDGVVDSVSMPTTHYKADELDFARYSAFQLELWSWLQEEASSLSAADASLYAGFDEFELGLRFFSQCSSLMSRNNLSFTVPIPHLGRTNAAYELQVSRVDKLVPSEGQSATRVRLLAETLYRCYMKQQSSTTAFVFKASQSAKGVCLVRPKTSKELQAAKGPQSQPLSTVGPRILAQLATLLERNRLLGMIEAELDEFAAVLAPGPTLVRDSDLPNAFSSFSKEYAVVLDMTYERCVETPPMFASSAASILQLWMVQFPICSSDEAVVCYVALFNSGKLRFATVSGVPAAIDTFASLDDCKSLASRLYQEATRTAVKSVECVLNKDLVKLRWKLGQRAIGGQLSKNYGLVVWPNPDFSGIKLEIKKILSRPLTEATAPTLQLSSILLNFEKASEKPRISMNQLLTKVQSLCNI